MRLATKPVLPYTQQSQAMSASQDAVSPNTNSHHVLGTQQARAHTQNVSGEKWGCKQMPYEKLCISEGHQRGCLSHPNSNVDQGHHTHPASTNHPPTL